LSGLAKNILQEVRADFVAKGLNAHALTGQYVGVSFSLLEQSHCGGDGATKVDFDLAAKELEEGQLVLTGPWVPYPNKPGSAVVILSLFSKREYMCLTEAGYKVATQKDSEKPRSNQPRVHISGGTFHQSQIGIGEQVTQVQRVEVQNDGVIERLSQLLLQTGALVDDTARAEIGQLVEVAHQGNGGAAKIIFQKLFGFGSETVKRAAWGVVTALITKALGT
jgi:hypothetical protein